MFAKSEQWGGIMHRFEAMDTFVRVVANGSFAGAAEEMNVSRAIVTKRIMQLETALGAKLLNRTTRRLSATEIGLRYFDFCSRILNEMREEEANIGRLQQQPLGHLKVLAAKSFGSLHMGQAVSSFIQLYPGIQVSLTLSDVTIRSLDPVEYGVDVAVRLQQQPDSSLFVRRLGTVVWVPCAAPAYIAQHGEAQHPLELGRHACLMHQVYMPDGHWQF
jgi:DNA-binding transcriptional LysR family regulator